MTTIKTTGSDIKTETLNSASSPEIGIIEPPTKPELEAFTKPMPKFDSYAERHYRFAYFFGIDSVEFKSKNINKTCGKITKEINIGNVDIIQLESSYHISRESSVEFSIIDQDKEMPILPIEDTIVRNEKIFFGMPLRFKIDRNEPFYIKKDGVEIDITPEAAINANDGEYTITYTPIDAHSYQPASEKIRVKVILRLNDVLSDPPFVRNAIIRAYGGDALWRDRL